MTAPNVGKVTLEASVKTDNLRNKLTRDISDKVLPQLKGLFEEIRKVNKEIGDVRSTPFEQMAKQAGVASRQAEAMAKATDQAKEKELQFQRAVNQGNSLANQREKALARVRAEIVKNGEATKITRDAFDVLDKKVDTAIENIITKETKWKRAQEEILRAGARAHEDYVRKVEAFRDSQIKSLDDVLAHTKATVNRTIAEAIKQTDKQIDEAHRHNDALDRERDREAASAERHRRREEERDEASARRRERREASSQRARARLVQRGLKSPIAVVGEIGRALSGFAPRLSTGAFSTIAAGVLLIAGAASSATQALYLLPAAATAAGVAMAALTVGTSGFGDTIKALLDGDLDKFDHLVNRLSGNAQQLALHIQQILPVFEGFKNKIQDALFVDTVPLMRGLVQSYLPVIEQLLASVAGSFNKYMRNLGAELLTPQVRDTIGLISQNIMGFFNQLTPIVKPLLQAFLDIAKVGSDLLPGMARGAVGLAQAFADFIRKARESGKLREWLMRGLSTVKQLAKLAWEIGRAFMSLAPVAEKILPYIVDFFKELADLLSRNPSAIYKFIAALAAIAAVKTIGNLLINLGLLAQGFGKTLPQAVREFGNKARGVFGLAARDAAVMSANTEKAARDIARLTTSTNAMSASSKAAMASAGAPALSTMIAGRLRGVAEGPLGAVGRGVYSRRETDIAGRATAIRESMSNSAKAALASIASVGTTTTSSIRNAVSSANTAIMTLPSTAIRAAEGAKRGLRGIDQALGSAVYSIRDKGRQAVGAVSDAAATAAPKVGGFLKAVGGILSLIGLGALIDDIVETNAKSDAALKNLSQDITDARDRGLALHDAFLQSKGVLDATTADALNSSLKEAIDHMHNLGQSSASWMDKFRGKDGGFSFGQTAKWLTGSLDDKDLAKIPIAGTWLSWLRDGAGGNKFDAEKAKGQPFRDAEKLLQDRFGSDLNGLDSVVSGDQGTFDALLETFRKSGDAGKIAIDMLQKVREQVTGMSLEAQQVGPIFEKLGPDIGKAFKDLKINIDALPKDVPIKLDDKGAKAVMEAFDKWGQKVTSDPITGELKINGDVIPEVAKALEALGVQIKKLPTGQVVITLDDQATPGIAKLRAALQLATLPVPTGTPGAPIGGGASLPANPFPLPPPGAPAIGPNLGAIPTLKPPPMPQLPPGGVPKPTADIPDALGRLPGDEGYIPPPADTKDERGNTIKKPSQKERREAIAATLDPKLWQVDPWSFNGSPNVTGGMMQVQLPQGIPGLTGIPGLPGLLVNPGMGNMGVTGGPTAWDQVLPHEGGTWNNADTGNNGHYGGLQFDPETWKAFGGVDLTGLSGPDIARATREQQIEIANRTAFTGYNGKAPQGLAAWEAITKGRVPGIDVNTPASAFMGGGGGGMPLNLGGVQVPGSGQQLTGDSSAQQMLEQIVRQNFPGVNLNMGGWRPSDGPGTPTGHQEGRAVDIGIPNFDTPEGKAIGDQINAFLRANAAQLGLGSTIWQDTWKDFKGNSSNVPGHMNHVHAELAKNALMGAPFGTAMSNGAFPNIALGNGMEVDPRALLEKQQNLQRQAFDLQESKRKLAILEHDDQATEQELLEARQKVVEDEQDLNKAQMDVIEAQTGKQSKPMDYSKLPFGDPRKIIAGAITGAGGSQQDADWFVNAFGGRFAKGGAPTGGIPGRDSIPALLMPGEHVLTAADVARMGGQSAVYAFRRALAHGGFSGGGVVDAFEEWLRMHPEARNGLPQRSLPTAFAGVPGSAPLAPNPSTSTGLGLLPSPNVNQGGSTAGQNFANLTGGVGGALENMATGLASAVAHPIDTLKGLAPLVGSEGADGAATAWTSLGKAMTHWDEWKNNPWGAAGGAFVDLGSLLLGGGGAFKALRPGTSTSVPYIARNLPAHTDEVESMIAKAQAAFNADRTLKEFNGNPNDLRLANDSPSWNLPARKTTGNMFSRNPTYLGSNLEFSPENLYRGLLARDYESLFDASGLIKGYGRGGQGDLLSMSAGKAIEDYISGHRSTSNVIMETLADATPVAAPTELSGMARKSGELIKYVEPLQRSLVEAGDIPVRVWMRFPPPGVTLTAWDEWVKVFDSFPDAMRDMPASRVAPLLAAIGGGSFIGQVSGRSTGGVLPGYSPGVDNMLVPMSGGEGVIIPEAMRALGSSWLYRLNSRFRSGISRRGYADGGVNGPWMPGTQEGAEQTNLLSQIRDILLSATQSRAPSNVGGTTINGAPPEENSSGLGTVLGGILGAPAGAIGAFAGDTAAAALTGLSPKFGGPGGPGVYALGTPTAPNANLNQLVQERNPLALASMAGFQVPDYTRQGGGADAQNLTLNGGPPNDAMGRIYSDTAALIDRTFTNLDAAEKARFDQMLSVATQTKDRLATDALGPMIKEAVTSGLTEAASTIGTKIGEAAAPAIADAVRNAMPSGGGGAGGEGGQLVNTGAGVLNNVMGGVGGFAEGGAPRGGIPGRDSIPALLMPGEHVLTTADVSRMGGQSAVYAFRQALARTGGLRGFATGGGVNVNDTVGAEFFGVSQVPIIGAIVNLLVKVLLKILGVNIEARDTLDEMTKDFRQFRGDFQAFDATGRLMNDTSGLLDRSSTSEETAAAERIRILKIVIEALIKFIIEKLIVPIGKAIANSLINAGAGAAGGAIGASFPGGSIVGGMVSSVISSAGTAFVDIGADIFQTFATSLSSVLIDAVGEGLQSYFPDLVTGLFGGGLLEGLFSPISALLGGILSPVLGLFGAVGSLGSFLPFDSGGIAVGKGFLPKATMDPEMVLSPQETRDFPNMVKAMQALADGRRGGNVTMHVPITVVGGGEQAAQKAYDELTRLIT